MGKLHFYVLWSLRDAPRQFMSKSSGRCFQVHVPLPLPKQLVIFGLGDWESCCGLISVDVLVSGDVRAQSIGNLSSQTSGDVRAQSIGNLSSETRSLTWEGAWSDAVASAAAEKGRKGVYGKIVLSMCEENDTDSVSRKWSFPQGQNEVSLSSTMLQSTINDTMTPNCTELSSSVCFGDVQVNKVDTSVCSDQSQPSAWPTDKTPRRTIISKRGLMTWSSEDADSPDVVLTRASTPKKRLVSRMNSQEEMTEQIKSNNREVSACPSRRWTHTMCLIDPDTAVLFGGETSGQNYCQDRLWKLELDHSSSGRDFWFPVDCSGSGHVPACAGGHSATYDPDSNSLYVYGGLREGLSYSDLYVLNTLTWKWTLVKTQGNVPTLAYHSAAFYKRELFVFGGVKPSSSSGERSCSNALYIFNPEFGLWYQPIVEGDKPLPRFGHSATFLSQKLVIFGGRKTATYLNDLHILDLGLMEYTAVKSANMAPLPRGYHAAVPLSNNRILVSGGCSAIGALQDAHIFNLDTRRWTAVVGAPLLSSVARAGHSVIVVGEERAEKPGERTLLVFGGSDCDGAFYNDSVKCVVDFSDK